MLLCTGCTVWQRVPARSVDDERVLVLTEKHAYELTEASIRDDKIVGHRERMWKPTRCSLEVTNESPDDLADVCRWSSVPATGGTLRIDLDVVTTVRAKRVSGPRTALAIGGGLLLAGLAVGVTGLILISQTPSH